MTNGGLNARHNTEEPSASSTTSSKHKCFTHEMFMSTLTPGEPDPVVISAMVEMQSTSDAVMPPWSVPPRFRCAGPTVISHTHLPPPPLTTFTCRWESRYSTTQATRSDVQFAAWHWLIGYLHLLMSAVYFKRWFTYESFALLKMMFKIVYSYVESQYLRRSHKSVRHGWIAVGYSAAKNRDETVSKMHMNFVFERCPQLPNTQLSLTFSAAKTNAGMFYVYLPPLTKYQNQDLLT